MSHWNSIGWVERVVLGSGVLEVGVCTEVMRGVRSSAIRVAHCGDGLVGVGQVCPSRRVRQRQGIRGPGAGLVSV